MRKLGIIATVALALGGAVLAAPAAQADTAAATDPAALVYDDGALWYKAAAGQENQLSVSVDVVDVDPSEFGDDFLITFRDKFDMAFDATAGSPAACTYPSATDHTVVQCTVPAPLGSDDSTNYEVDLGDRADTATIDDRSATAAIHGGSGDDVLKGNGQTQYNGGDGDDRIDGGDGMGANGGNGDDTITGACAYVCHGDAGNDTLTGTGDQNAMYGDDGSDIVHAGSDNDEVYGGKGNDTLYGEDGNDTMYGNSGDDVLYGGKGTDTLSGGPGTNEVYQD
ncbi:calcium-binding protein [Streptomyces spongiae]|uniref:Calcium-binding protein n=1 Tax=Streptomyces spongiae TaxID=565072 RepID=A0A5N8XJ94_9ACTN|nr:calcium-binding protein [Streptomyces spongiae]MPY59541.1 calcium-binding protein [Streptomyces spongiae]